MSYAHNYWTSNDRPRIPHGEMRSLLVQPASADMEALCLVGHCVSVTRAAEDWEVRCTCGASATGRLLSLALNLPHLIVPGSVVAPVACCV